MGIVEDMPSFERDMGGPASGPSDTFPPSGDGSFRRNNPNVAPREGDWICSEETCGNLNFARRSHCNNCNKPRQEIHGFGTGVTGPPDAFQGTLHPDFVDGPPGGRGVERGGFVPNPDGWGYGVPPRKFERDFNHGLPPRINESYRPERDLRDRQGFHDRYDYQSRDKFGRPPMDRGFYGGINRSRERTERYQDKKGLDYDFKGDKRQDSPQPRWGRDIRDRSRSPERGLPRNIHVDQHRDDRRDERRDR